MAKNFPSLGRDLDIQVHEAHRAPNKLNSKKNSSPTHYSKTVNYQKQRILKASRGDKVISYKRILIRLKVDFSAETSQSRREWDDIFKLLKKKKNPKQTKKPANQAYPIHCNYPS